MALGPGSGAPVVLFFARETRLNSLACLPILLKAMAVPTSRTHAVVLGASIGGICAAEALAPHFDQVTLLEKDVLPTTPEGRRGVPQGNQPHALQMRGRKELDAL